jgi:non-heme chloroperoxidase
MRRRTVNVVMLLGLACIVAPRAAWAQEELRSRHFTTSDGIHLHYLEAGSGPTLVFVPGWTMPAEIWQPQLRHFASSHRVVAFDPRGHGRSEKPTYGYHPLRRSRDIGELLQHLGGEPPVVVGWSLGVPEAVVYAQEFGADAIRAFVLVGWDIAGNEPIDEEGLAFIRSRVERVLLNRPAYTRAFIASLYATPQPEAYLDRIVEAALAMPDNAAALVTANVALFGPLDLRPALQAVNRPMLFVFSSLDWALVAAEKARRDRPDDRVEVIDGTSHALFVDKPEEFNRLLEEFLASLPEQRRLPSSSDAAAVSHNEKLCRAVGAVAAPE